MAIVNQVDMCSGSTRLSSDESANAAIEIMSTSGSEENELLWPTSKRRRGLNKSRAFRWAVDQWSICIHAELRVRRERCVSALKTNTVARASYRHFKKHARGTTGLKLACPPDPGEYPEDVGTKDYNQIRHSIAGQYPTPPLRRDATCQG